MIKLVVSGIWICVLSLASVYFSMQASSGETEEKPADFFGGLDYVRGDILSVPVMSGGIVHGYFLTRLVYTVDPRDMAELSVPPNALITDELYSLLVGDRVIDFPDMDNFDMDAFKTRIKDDLNERVGKKIFHDVMVEQMDYLTKRDVRANLSERHYTMTKGEPIPDADTGAPEQPGQDESAGH